MDKYEIILKAGFSDIKFGMSRDKATELLGQPHNIEKEEMGDEVIYFLEYPDLGVSLHFSSDEDYLLSMISFYDKRYRLGTDQLIGKPKSDFLSAIKIAGYDDLHFDNEVSDEDTQFYYSDSQCLSIVLNDGIVSEITIFNDFDEDGNPVWPE